MPLSLLLQFIGFHTIYAWRKQLMSLVRVATWLSYDNFVMTVDFGDLQGHTFHSFVVDKQSAFAHTLN